MEAKKKTKVQFRYCLSLKKKKRFSVCWKQQRCDNLKKNSCAFILSYCVSVLSHKSLISLYEITISSICWYLFDLSCSTVILSIMCIMISGILITAKCHKHVPQSWNLYTEWKTDTQNFLKVLKKNHVFDSRSCVRLYYC